MNLANYIRLVPNFPKPDVSFKDITPLLAEPEAFRYVVSKIADDWRDAGVHRIGVFDARGFLFGSAVAYELELPLFPFRKKGKLPHTTVSETYALEYGTDTLEIHTDALNSDEHILLVDDLLATGGTALAGCKLVEKLGGKVIGCQFVIELTELSGRKVLRGYDTRSLISY